MSRPNDIPHITLSSELSDARTISSPSRLRSSPPSRPHISRTRTDPTTSDDDSDTESSSSLEHLRSEDVADVTPTQSQKRDRTDSSGSIDTPPGVKRRRAPLDAPRITKTQYEEVRTFMKNRNISTTSFIHFIIRSSSRAREVLGNVLVDPPETAHKWMEALTMRYLESRQWEPLSRLLANELLAFGDATLQQDHPVDAIGSSTGLWDTGSIERLSSFDTQQKHSPTWLRLFRDILYTGHRPSQEVKQRRNDDVFYGGMLSFLAYRMRPRTFNALGKVLGMFLHGCGLTRKGLEVLNSFGVIASYAAINDAIKQVSARHKLALRWFGADVRRVVVYDNFNVTDGVRHIRIGDERKIWNVTSGLVKIGRSIPLTGLDKAMLRPLFKLRQSDIVHIDAHQMRKDDNLNREVWNHYISSAVKRCFPNTKQAVPTTDMVATDVFHVGLPVLQRPASHEPTEMIALGPLMFNEATETGNAEILDDIYRNQFNIPLNDSQWEDKLFLHFGDAMTTARINSLKNNRQICKGAHARMDWAIPVFGLWHLRYNFLKLIHKHHWGSIDDDRSSLHFSWHSVYTNRAFDPTLFEHLHHLIVQSFESRVIALLRIRVGHHISTMDTARGIQNLDSGLENGDTLPTITAASSAFDHTRTHYHQAEQWIDRLSSAQLGNLVDSIRQDILTSIQERDPDTTSCDPDADDEFQNHLNFLHNTLPYLLLTDAIKVSDIGLLRTAIRQCLLVFVGTGENYIYQRELCYYHWLASTDAAAKPLQDAVLSESLMNTTGGADSYHEIDKANELLNNYLRTIKTTRRTSSLPMNVLLDRYTRLYGFHWQLSNVIQKTAGTYTDSTHTEKKQLDQLWLCATNLLLPLRGHGPSVMHSPGRGALGRTPWLLRDGMKKIAKVVSNFNDWRQNMDAGEVDEHGQPRFNNDDRSFWQYMHNIHILQQRDHEDSMIPDHTTEYEEAIRLPESQYPKYGGGQDMDLDCIEIDNVVDSLASRDQFHPTEDGEPTSSPNIYTLQRDILIDEDLQADGDIVNATLGDDIDLDLTELDISNHDDQDVYQQGSADNTDSVYDLPTV